MRPYILDRKVSYASARDNVYTCNGETGLWTSEKYPQLQNKSNMVPAIDTCMSMFFFFLEYTAMYLFL